MAKHTPGDVQGCVIFQSDGLPAGPNTVSGIQSCTLEMLWTLITTTFKSHRDD